MAFKDNLKVFAAPIVILIVLVAAVYLQFFSQPSKIQIVYDSPLNSLNPYTYSDFNTSRLNYIYESLISYDQNLNLLPVLATSYGKIDPLTVEFKLKGDECSLDQERLSLLSDAIMHLIRNSLDHGIEDPETRKKLGKKESGNIEVNFSIKNNQLIIDVNDDGSGIDTDKIRDKLTELGVSKNISDDELLQYIFNPSFSTADKVTEISGQGMGMNIIKEIAEDLGGHVKVKSQKNIGTSFLFTIPVIEEF